MPTHLNDGMLLAVVKCSIAVPYWDVVMGTRLSCHPPIGLRGFQSALWSCFETN